MAFHTVPSKRCSILRICPFMNRWLLILLTSFSQIVATTRSDCTCSGEEVGHRTASVLRIVESHPASRSGTYLDPMDLNSLERMSRICSTANAHAHGGCDHICRCSMQWVPARLQPIVRGPGQGERNDWNSFCSGCLDRLVDAELHCAIVSRNRLLLRACYFQGLFYTQISGESVALRL